MPKKLVRPRWLVVGAVAGLAVLWWVATAVAPWIAVANHPVQVRLTASGNSAIDLCWSDSPTDCLPLVPATVRGASGMETLWLAELPPLREYRLSLRFPDGIEAAELAEWTVISTDSGSPFLSVRAPATVEWTARDVSIAPNAKSIRITARPGGVLILPGSTVHPSEYNGIGKLTCFALLVVCVGLLALVLFFLFRGMEKSFPRREHPRGFWLAVCIALLLHTILVANAIMDYDPKADHQVYLAHAVQLIEHRSYAIPGMTDWNQMVRTPGYPLFLAFVVGFLGGIHLSTIGLVQGWLMVGTLSLLAWALRGCAPDWLLNVALVLSAMLPPIVWSSRAVMSDGPFAAFCFLSLASLFEALRHHGKARCLWMAVFTLSTSFGVLIRPTASVVLLGPGILIISVLADAWRNHARPQALIIAYIVAVLVPFVVLGAWSFRNGVRYGYPVISSYTDMVRLAGLIENGYFDVRALDPGAIYSGYVRGRYDIRYWQYHVQLLGLISSVKHIDTPRQLNAALSQVTRASLGHTPWQLRAAVLIRSFWQAAVVPNVSNHGGFAMRNWPTAFFGLQSAQQVPVVRSIETELRKTLPDGVYDVRYRVAPTNVYVALTQNHASWHFPLLLAVSAAMCVCLVRRRAFLAVPFVVYVAMLAGHVLLVGLVFTRYTTMLMPLLLFQIALGFGQAVAARDEVEVGVGTPSRRPS